MILIQAQACFTNILGGDGDRVTPVPIPNTEVKPICADGTTWATGWESRTLPGFLLKPLFLGAGVFLCYESTLFVAGPHTLIDGSAGVAKGPVAPHVEVVNDCDDVGPFHRTVTHHFIMVTARAPDWCQAFLRACVSKRSIRAGRPGWTWIRRQKSGLA
jgi:hypothetical protein